MESVWKTVVPSFSKEVILAVLSVSVDVLAVLPVSVDVLAVRSVSVDVLVTGRWLKRFAI